MTTDWMMTVRNPASMTPSCRWRKACYKFLFNIFLPLALFSPFCCITMPNFIVFYQDFTWMTITKYDMMVFSINQNSWKSRNTKETVSRVLSLSQEIDDVTNMEEGALLKYDQTIMFMRKTLWVGKLKHLYRDNSCGNFMLWGYLFL